MKKGKLLLVVILIMFLCVVMFACNENECTITFVSNGGTSVSSITAKAGEALTEPVEPTREDYVFGGWYTDDVSFSNAYIFF